MVLHAKGLDATLLLSELVRNKNCCYYYYYVEKKTSEETFLAIFCTFLIEDLL